MDQASSEQVETNEEEVEIDAIPITCPTNRWNAPAEMANEKSRLGRSYKQASLLLK